MKTVDYYLTAAKARAGLRADAELARALGLQRVAVSQWRHAKAWPSDDSMVQLAQLAGEDAGEALLHLHVWRSQGAARGVYATLLQRLVPAVIFLAVATVWQPSRAGTHAEQAAPDTARSTYYATLRRRLMRRLAALAAAPRHHAAAASR